MTTDCRWLTSPKFKTDLRDNCNARQSSLLGLDKVNDPFFSESYFSNDLCDISIDPNGNVSGISPNNYLTEIAKPYAKQFFFEKLYDKGQKLFGPNFSLEWILDGTIYMHDATKLQPYCFGVSATEIATEGRPYATLIAEPPKRLESFMGQMVEFIMDCSQEFAGAIAVTDLVPWMAWFIEKGRTISDDILEMIPENYYVIWESYLSDYTDKQIENSFQSFVHVLNNTFRIGGDSPFTNISVNSKKVYYDIFEHYVFPDGKTLDDLWPTIKRVQKIIVEFMAKGQSNGLPYTFPILTANFKSDKSESKSEWFNWVTGKNSKGFLNVNFAERFAMCCRLQLDFDFKQNSFGGGGVKVGSMRVGNINLPRVMYRSLSKTGGKFNKDNFLMELKFTIEKDIEYLLSYAEIFKDLIDIGYLKFFKAPAQWFDINMFFATVGFCGIWDAAELVTDNIEDRVSLMDEIVEVFVEKTKAKSNGIKFNVEEVPSETAAGKMCRFNDDFGEKKEYYSNQFIPLDYDIDMPTRIKYESQLQSKLTGGGMTFLNFESELTSEQSQEIHKYILDTGFVGQFCINYGYSYCGKHTTVGRIESCPVCNKPTDFYTRVVGYFTKEKNTAQSKRSEIVERNYY